VNRLAEFADGHIALEMSAAVEQFLPKQNGITVLM
jgi:hypothetical protein